jgi:uncharacterized protein (TIGR00251 family)
MSDWFRIAGDRVFLDVKTVPGSSKTEIAGIANNRLRIRVASAPEKGKANLELVSFLAKLLTCAKNQIIIQSGKRSRHKTLSLPISVEQKLKLLRGEI